VVGWVFSVVLQGYGEIVKALQMPIYILRQDSATSLHVNGTEEEK
jgi:hypothetical protein